MGGNIASYINLIKSDSNFYFLKKSFNKFIVKKKKIFD